MRRIITVLILCMCIGLPFVGSSVKADGIRITQELPSDAYMKSEQQSGSTSLVDSRSVLSSTLSGPVSSPISTFSTTIGSDGWTDPLFPGQGGEDGDGGVTGPIGDATPMVVVLFIILYFVYRGVVISKRKNNI